MVERERIVNFRVSDVEHAMLARVAEAEGEAISVVLRRMIRQRYEVHFDDAPPPAVASGR